MTKMNNANIHLIIFSLFCDYIWYLIYIKMLFSNMKHKKTKRLNNVT